MDIRPGFVIDHYEFMGPVSQGGLTNRFLVRSRKYDRFFVAKITRVDGDVDLAWSSFDAWMKRMRDLTSPYITKICSHYRHGNNLICIWERWINGPMLDYIKKNGPLKGSHAIRVVKGMCTGIRESWLQGVYHGNLKPSNVLIDDTGRPKLLDFDIPGLSRDVSDTAVSYSRICQAPEMFDGLECDAEKRDIWALGVTILWMCSGTPPWNEAQMEEQIRAGEFVTPKGMDEPLMQVVRRMLDIDPQKRQLPSEEMLEKMTKLEKGDGRRVSISNGTISGCKVTSMPLTGPTAVIDRRRGSGGEVMRLGAVARNRTDGRFRKQDLAQGRPRQSLALPTGLGARLVMKDIANGMEAGAKQEGGSGEAKKEE